MYGIDLQILQYFNCHLIQSNECIYIYNANGSLKQKLSLKNLQHIYC